MKKKIFMLIINTALFVTNPLFAMEVPEDQHACPTCKKDMVRFSLSKMEPTEENGDLNKLGEKSIIIYMISLIDIKDLCSLSNTSKEMYNTCQNPSIWKFLSENEHRFSILSDTKCPKMDFEKAYLKFSKTLPRSFAVSLVGEKVHYTRRGKVKKSRRLDKNSLNIFQNFLNHQQ